MGLGKGATMFLVVLLGERTVREGVVGELTLEEEVVCSPGRLYTKPARVAPDPGEEEMMRAPGEPWLTPCVFIRCGCPAATLASAAAGPTL